MDTVALRCPAQQLSLVCGLGAEKHIVPETIISNSSVYCITKKNGIIVLSIHLYINLICDSRRIYLMLTN